MAISRPFLLALLGVALLGATVFAVSNARNTAGDKSASVAKQPAEQAAPAPAPPTPEPAQASGELSAKEAVAAMLSPGKPVDSARFSLSLDGKEIGGHKEHDYAKLAGTFASSGNGVPSFDLRATSHDEEPGGKGANYDYRILTDGEHGFVGSGDTLHEVPGRGLENIGKLRDAMAGGPVSKFKEFDPARFVKDVKVVGVEKMDGVDATHVSGTIVAGDLAKDIVRLVRLEAQGSGAQSALPANTPAMARKAVNRAELDAWVGADRVVRRIHVSLVADVPKRLLDRGESPRQTAEIDFRLSQVNDVDPIKAPDNVAEGAATKTLSKKQADSARTWLNVSAMTIDAPGGLSGTTFAFLVLNRAADSEKVAKKVLRAVEQDKEVVVFFRNPRALDDKATAESIKYLDSHAKKLVVFTDDVEHTRSYGKLLENLGVTQAPAIVFINRRGTASLVEGYVDGPSLAQVIADAR
jgi:hypothetical protein